jgi:hypothetical protein
VATLARSGFETEISLGYLRDRYIAVRARGSSGEPLGTSLVQKRPAR